MTCRVIPVPLTESGSASVAGYRDSTTVTVTGQKIEPLSSNLLPASLDCRCSLKVDLQASVSTFTTVIKLIALDRLI